MVIAHILLALTAHTGEPCAAATVQASLQQAIAAYQKKDIAGAKAAVAPALACPVDSGPAYVAHALRAEIAAGEGDWPTARASLDPIGVHAEMPMSGRVGFTRLRADQGLADATAFAADRAALVAANDQRLTAAGRKIETFRVGAADVTAYETPVDQGPFHRVTEFIVVPDDAALYPASILLTDDVQTAQIMKEMAPAGGKPAEHAWFVDLYTCSSHATLSMPMAADGAQPAYADLRRQVEKTLAGNAAVAAKTPPERGICFSAAWILPGLGLH